MFAAGIYDLVTLARSERASGMHAQHSEDLEYIALAYHTVRYGDQDETEWV